MHALTAKLRTLASAVTLSALAGLGSYAGTYRVLLWMSQPAAETPIVATAHPSAAVALPHDAPLGAPTPLP